MTSAAGALPDGGALTGIRVVDLSRVLAGPLCTQLLADHGAAVIKVEPPAGDETRTLGPPFTATGDAAYYSALNRGKRTLSLDLARPAGREVLERLLQDADVLVENFLPGTLERWGLGPESLRVRFPRLIVCRISGFGADGPLGGLPGYDAVLQALCGLMSVNGDPASGPTRVGVPIVDHLTAYVAFSGILLALRSRQSSGCGQQVEATLFDSALSLLLPHVANWLHSGRAPGLLGSAHPNIAPYDRFAVADGAIFLGIVNDGQFRRFSNELGAPELAADPRYADNAGRLAHRAELTAAIAGLLAGQPAAALCERLMRCGVPVAPVHDVPAAFAQAHARHRGVLIESGEYRGVRSPIRLEQTPGAPGGAPPVFAQDTRELLSALGYDEARIAALIAEGITPLVRTERS